MPAKKKPQMNKVNAKESVQLVTNFHDESGLGKDQIFLNPFL
jgi:hypothetical protein